MIGLFRKTLDDNDLRLLSAFLEPRGLDTEEWQDKWSVTLGHSYKKAISSFIKYDLLTEANTAQKLGIGLRVADLMPVLKVYGLNASGTKAKLIACLIENEPAEAERLASRVEGYVCTPDGAELASAYIERVAVSQREAERKVRAALHQGKVAQACSIADAFRASLPAPIAGRIAGAKTNPAQAQAFLAVNSVPGMSREEVTRAALEAAEAAIWRRKPDVPQEFTAAAYTMMFRASNQADLKRFRDWGVSQVDILVARRSCSTCQSLAAKGPYPINKVPVLPNPECTHSMGWCRCTYQARFE